MQSYAPPNADRRDRVLARKRQEYKEWVLQFYEIPNEDRSDEEIHSLRQVGASPPDFWSVACFILNCVFMDGCRYLLTVLAQYPTFLSFSKP